MLVADDQKITQSLVFLGIYSLISLGLGLPFSLYYTFVIEERHGFNKQTLALFFTDLLKTIVLSTLIGGPMIAAFLYLIKYTGDQFFFYVWIFMFVFYYPGLLRKLGSVSS
jgi:STE24 endopeptidase